ncbi:MAG: carbon-nitrogen hydrolase family protein [Bdellovibrionales bacterium]|nr:carbon-nitrogen hydrolase family protein [Bdellovibrionales bacterium]
MDRFVAAAIQMRSSVGDVRGNLEKALRLVSDAAANGASLVTLPECCNFGYGLDQILASTPADIPDARGAFSSLAVARKVFIVVGLVEHVGGTIQNNTVIFGPQGQMGVYTKVHLFSSAPSFEDGVFSRGGKRLLVDTDVGKIGTIICYDIRFPELSRSLALDGAEIFTVSSAWPSSRAAALRGLCLGRATENIAYLISANQVGTNSDTLKFAGQSSIVDFEGNVLASAGEGEECIISAELDMVRLRKLRGAIPVFSHRRPDVYGFS